MSEVGAPRHGSECFRTLATMSALQLITCINVLLVEVLVFYGQEASDL
jgi:hypothetical protein